MKRLVPMSRLALLLAVGCGAPAGLLHGAEAPKVFGKVTRIARVEAARAAPVVRPDRTTNYVLVAYSSRFNGWIEIGPTCIGADKLTARDIRARVAGIEKQFETQTEAELQAAQAALARNVARAPNRGPCSAPS